MNAEIVRQLSVITEEEQKILDGQKNINKTLYTKKKAHLLLMLSSMQTRF